MSENGNEGFPTWMVAVVMVVMLVIGGVAGYNLASYNVQKNLGTGMEKCESLGGDAVLYKDDTEIRWRCVDFNTAP